MQSTKDLFLTSIYKYIVYPKGSQHTNIRVGLIYLKFLGNLHYET